MSNTDKPAGASGGDNVTSAHPELADLPPKLRVHALAKVLGVESKVVIATLNDLGEVVRGAQSSVARDVALKVAEVLLTWDDIVTGELDEQYEEPAVTPREAREAVALAPVFAAPSPVFLPPQPADEPPAPKKSRGRVRVVEEPEPELVEEIDEDQDDQADDADLNGDESDSRRRRRRGRRGRGRGKGAEDSGSDEDESSEAEQEEPEDQAEEAEDTAGDDGGSRRRRRRRRRKTGAEDEPVVTEDDPPNTVVHVRETRDARDDRADSAAAQDEVRSVRGSTRLEAKRQRRRDGREAGRRRAPVLSESEFLARREAVERTMVVRERGDRTQIGVLEDGVLVEHFVTSSGTGSLVGNVYLGRVQNVLPSMEAAFIDIGRGRNAVLYAGEVDWDAAGLEGKARKIEQALSSGDSVLVQVTKDPVGHKGARLTTQISLPGRFLVYVPGGGATGISRKLPDTERKRLKDILKRVVPEDAGVIIRTASEGVAEEELGRDVTRLQAQWQVIKDKAATPKAQAPQLLYEEPDLLVKVVRDLFTEDFSALIVQGDDAWETIDAYVRHVAPDLQDRLRKHVSNTDAFTAHRIDEQLLKALDRKVWLPSGGYLVIDRTEAMTVIDVNTGKFTGSGGNLEETVTRNNLESAEEIVRQLRLRDIGGIIVIDFIDMVLESNRDLVLRRLTECLGRDRTRHQVAEVTSLGLVQMTRKRVGTGLLEAFSTTCEHCRGRGVVMSTDPVHSHGGGQGGGQGNGGTQQGGGQNSGGGQNGGGAQSQGGGRKSRQRNRGGDQGSAQAETPVQPEIPVVEAPVVETPVVEAPVVETPVVEAPVVETPVVETPAVDASAAEAAVTEPVADVVVPAQATTASENEVESTPLTESAVSVDQDEPDSGKRERRGRRRARRDTGAPVKHEAGEIESVSAVATLNGHAPAQPPVEMPAPVVTTKRRTSRRAASRPAGPPQGGDTES
ncbi:Rne/Rng family ribonuclease [Umezawaea beigongshangensis]|uniref:Rne/Rng family ribonuclease n=1 Tax=Umezawaea beigongshangensis TaxID=2780383 RepID=UPI0018F17214|nr:Rne/Rng family ribonuclease [Umezawaea beigongshangensis]